MKQKTKNVVDAVIEEAHSILSRFVPSAVEMVGEGFTGEISVIVSLHEGGVRRKPEVIVSYR